MLLVVLIYVGYPNINDTVFALFRSPRTKMSPRSLFEVSTIVLFVSVFLVFSKDIIKGSSCTADGLKVFAHKLANSSLTSLYLIVISTPTVQGRACCTVNFAPQPLQWVLRSRGAQQYRMCRRYLNSNGESSVLLYVLGIVFNQAPVSDPVNTCRRTFAKSFLKETRRIFVLDSVFLFRISDLIYAYETWCSV